MDPNAGEPVNPSGTAVADKPVFVASPPDIARVEGLVAAAQQKAKPAQTTPKAQFENQFGPPPQATTPPEQTQPPAAETLAPEPEQTPAEKLKKQIADSVDAFLEKVTKEKVAA